MSQIIELSCPLSREAAARLRAGDVVRLTGVIFSARDAAHKRICAALEPDDNVRPLRKQVGDLSLAFVAPVGSDDRFDHS